MKIKTILKKKKSMRYSNNNTRKKNGKDVQIIPLIIATTRLNRELKHTKICDNSIIS